MMQIYQEPLPPDVEVIFLILSTGSSGDFSGSALSA
jgi:hypothetical protein